MSLYVRKSRKYFAALTILRNNITNEANDVLTNHGTVLNFDAIIARLDFAYSDKRPIHIIEQELSVLRQGTMTVIEYYNLVNKKLTLLINKTIMTHGNSAEITKELNKRNRNHALRIFITGLNEPLRDIIFSLNPQDLPDALAKAQELESNNQRARFAQNFANEQLRVRQNYPSNNLRFPRRNNYSGEQQNAFPKTQANNFVKDQQSSYSKHEPMDVDPSVSRIYNGNYNAQVHQNANTTNKNTRPAWNNSNPNANSPQTQNYHGVKRARESENSYRP